MQGGACHFVELQHRNIERKEKERERRERETKTVILTLCYCQALVGGEAGRRVTQRKQALHVRRKNTGLPLSWHSVTRKRQHGLCVCMYMCDQWRGRRDKMEV